MAILLNAGMEGGGLGEFSTSAAGGGSVIAASQTFAKEGSWSLHAQVASAEVAYTRFDHSTSYSVVGAFVRINALPTLRRAILLSFYNAETMNASIDIDSAGVLYAKLGFNGTETSQAGRSVTTGMWFSLEYLAFTASQPSTMAWRVAGVDQPSLSVSPGDSDLSNDSRFGCPHGGSPFPSSTLDVYIDRIMVGDNPSDYPLVFPSFIPTNVNPEQAITTPGRW